MHVKVNSARSSLILSPAFPCGVAGDCSPPLWRKRSRSRGAALQASEPSQRGGMRVGADVLGVTRDDLDSLGRRTATATRCSDGVGLLWFVELDFRLADQAATPHQYDRFLDA
jgi:hypothetical protein